MPGSPRHGRLDLLMDGRLGHALVAVDPDDLHDHLNNLHHWQRLHVVVRELSLGGP
jgi:hypothetical protein